MNKYLLLSAAAALTATGAHAGTPAHSFTFGTASGGSYCDGGTVYTNGSTAWAWQHTNNNCSGGQSHGQGLLGDLGAATPKKKAKKSADMSDNYFGSSSLGLSFVLPGKIKQGAHWSLYLEISGTTSFEANSGVLNNVTPGHKGTKSTVSMLKQLVQVHKASKRS